MVVPDETHCGGGCIEGVGCVVYPLDDDGDGFESAACPGAAGDDCDDSRDDVHPAAEEVCDGVDNDCDGIQGVQAGLTPSGSVEPIADWDDAAIAWSDVAGSFVIAGSHSKAVAEDAVFVGDITTSGAITTSSTPWLDLTSASGGWVSAVAVLDDGSRLVDAYYGDRSGDYVRILHIDPTAREPLVDIVGSSRHDVASRGADVVLVRASGAQIGVHVVPDDATQPATFDVVTAFYPRIATHGDDSAIVWERDGAIYASRISTTVLAAPDAGVRARLVASDPDTLSEEGTSPDIDSLPGGYVVAWRDPHGFRLSVVGVDGTRRCGPVAHIFGDVTDDTDRSLAVAYGARGIFLVVTDTSSNEVGVYRFDDSCKLVDHAAIGAPGVEPLLPAIASGGGALAVLWSEGVDRTTREAHARIMTDVLCE